MDRTQLFLLVLLSCSLVAKVISLFLILMFSPLTHPPLVQTEAGLLDNILWWVGLGVEVEVEVGAGGEESVVEAAAEDSEEVPAEAEDPGPVDGEVQDESIEEPETIPEQSKPGADEL